jgi:hypothetical protein
MSLISSSINFIFREVFGPKFSKLSVCMFFMLSAVFTSSFLSTYKRSRCDADLGFRVVETLVPELDFCLIGLFIYVS